MRKEDRKAAIAAYKEQKSVAGVFAVRSAGPGEAWVGLSRNLDQAPNRLWFTLRNGGQATASLLRAYLEQGAEAFSFEVLERAPEDAETYTLDSFLRERVAHWRATLGAQAV